MANIMVLERWKSDNGETWPYSGSSSPRMDNMPDEVRSRIEGGAVVEDTLLEIKISHDGSAFVIRICDT